MDLSIILFFPRIKSSSIILYDYSHKSWFSSGANPYGSPTLLFAQSVLDGVLHQRLDAQCRDQKNRITSFKAKTRKLLTLTRTAASGSGLPRYPQANASLSRSRAIWSDCRLYILLFSSFLIHNKKPCIQAVLLLPVYTAFCYLSMFRYAKKTLNALCCAVLCCAVLCCAVL